MSKPKPIRVQTYSDRAPKIEILCINYKSKTFPSYLSVETHPREFYGYIEDRDVKRLLKWCQDCLKERKR